MWVWVGGSRVHWDNHTQFEMYICLVFSQMKFSDNCLIIQSTLYMMYSASIFLGMFYYYY